MEKIIFQSKWSFHWWSKKLLQKAVVTKFNGEYICTPMEVYSQVVNGQNYKVLLLGKHSQTKDFKCFSGITYFPPGQIPEPQFKEDTFKATDETECKLTAEKTDKLKSSVKEFFQEDKEFTPIKFFENAFEGANVYVLKVGNQFIGVFEAGNEMSVDCILN